jgi:uncharacterized protein (TIGR02147 family)
VSNTESRNHRYRDWLLQEFASRKGRNSSYSIRAFAKSLGVGKTTLAAVLQGERHFSKITALRVAEVLGFSPQKKNILLKEIRRPSVTEVFDPLKDSVDQVEFLQLQEDQFRLISNWYYIGILTLAQLKDHRADPNWIAERLGISPAEVEVALAALQRLALIEIRGRRLVRTSLPIQSTHQIPSPAIRSYHRQNLRLAEASLENEPLDRRIFGAISFPVNPADMAKADALIRDFKVQMAALMESKAASEIFTLSVQLFPMTRPKGEINHGFANQSE